MQKKKSTTEYDRFSDFLTGILRMSHAEIKSELQKEKEAKKRKNTRKSSASREVNGRA
jgi:hypothetical protein